MPVIELNPGGQYSFVMSEARHSAYMGGRGAGKTLASCLRGVLYAQQPKIPGLLPPTGCLLAISMPQLKAIVYPAMYLLFEMLGYKENKDWYEVKNQSDRKFVLTENGAQILMRSLDEPNKLRGLNLSWFGIDEGRLFDTDEAYQILLACLRQGRHPDDAIDAEGLWVPGENYKHGGWVTSTPNGFDWMWRRFHPDSPKRRPGTEWYNASTYENKKHLSAAFIEDLEVDYEKGSLWYRQEVLGEFVGAVKGAVWPMYDPKHHTDTIEYDPDLPLYAGWDFGIGDASVCLFVQIRYDTRTASTGGTIEVPLLRIVGCISAADKTVKEFAYDFHTYCQKHFGKLPTAQWGDPSAIARQQVGGTSTLAAFAEEGVYIRPAPRRPIDEGIIVVQTLMDRAGGFIIKEDLEEVQKAVQTYRWKIDELGNRLAKEPIHDWTSHICSALRYLAVGAIGLYSRRMPEPVVEHQPGTMGYIMDKLLEEPELVMNQDEPGLDYWHPDRPVGLEGLLG